MPVVAKLLTLCSCDYVSFTLPKGPLPPFLIGPLWMMQKRRERRREHAAIMFIVSSSCSFPLFVIVLFFISGAKFLQKSYEPYDIEYSTGRTLSAFTCFHSDEMCCAWFTDSTEICKRIYALLSVAHCSNMCGLRDDTVQKKWFFNQLKWWNIHAWIHVCLLYCLCFDEMI